MKWFITLVTALMVAQFAWAMSTIQNLATQAAGNARQIEYMAASINQLRTDIEKVKDVLDRVRYNQLKP